MRWLTPVEHRQQLAVLLKVSKIMLGQVMSLNIGAALWVAAGGEGRLRCSADGPSAAADGLLYCSQACGFGSAVSVPRQLGTSSQADLRELHSECQRGTV